MRLSLVNNLPFSIVLNIIHLTMSHVKEIKEKQALQAKFQLAINSTTNHVSSWLKPLKTTNQDSSSSSTVSNNDFFDLPIISGGSGLALSSDLHNKEDINTIGDYVKSGKSLSSLNKKKTQQRPIHQVHKVHKDDSKALSSLRNEMKNSSRLKQRDQLVQPKLQAKPQQQQHNHQSNSNDSDSDEEIVQKSAPKKNFSLMIDSKIKKKKK